MLHKSFIPWRHTHTGVIGHEYIPLSAEHEPARHPTWRAYYERGKTEPSWTEALPTGRLRRVDVEIDDLERHGVIASTS